jgi:nifR3 family TIM-barrel protein
MNNRLSNFWQNLPRPFFVLAPMADVTDAAFRQIIAKHSRHGEPGGGPDVFFTEFVSADGLCSPGRDILLRDFVYSDREHPIVAQIFSSHPEHILKAAELVRSLGFDGLDLNMGCPDKSLEKQGSGAAHIKDPQLAKELILAAQQGMQGLPVSVKTRIGYNQETLDTWLPQLLETKPAAVTIHARTRKELSLVPARWELIKRAVVIAQGSGTLIIGNGDVQNLTDARKKVVDTGADGVMLGRAIFGTPWLFDQNRMAPPTISEKLEIMIEHTYLFEKLLGDLKDFSIMKKHFKAYVNGFDGAKELRMQLMETKKASEVEDIIKRQVY